MDKLIVDLDTFVKAIRAEGVRIALGTSAENYLEKVFQKKVGYGRTHCLFECPCYQAKVDYAQVVCSNDRELGRGAFALEVYPTIKREDLDDVAAGIMKVVDA